MTTSEGGNLEQTLSQIVQRAQTDPAYRSRLDGAVGELREAGLPDALLVPLLQAAGMEDQDVTAFGMDLAPSLGGALGGSTGGSPGGSPGGEGIIIGGVCVGTCKSATIVVGCTVSFKN